MDHNASFIQNFKQIAALRSPLTFSKSCPNCFRSLRAVASMLQSANDNVMSRWDSAPVVMGNTIYNYARATAAAAKQGVKAVEADGEGTEDEPLSFLSKPHEDSVAEEVEGEAEREESGSGASSERASLNDGSISSSEEDTEEEDTITHHLRQDKVKLLCAVL